MNEKNQVIMFEHVPRIQRLTPGSSGNYSLREREKIYITPSGIDYKKLEPGRFPVVSLNNGTCHSELKPSSELPTHRSIYEALDAQAIVHTHSPWATTVSTLGKPLSYVHYTAARAGESVPTVEYVTYGSEELANKIIGVVKSTESQACLLENHGVLTYGNELAEAFEIAEAVEFTARIQCQAQSIGDPRTLTETEIKEVVEKFKQYGQDLPDEKNHP